MYRCNTWMEKSLKDAFYTTHQTLRCILYPGNEQTMCEHSLQILMTASMQMEERILLGEGIVKNVVDMLLERMREMETFKGPPVVHGFSMLRLAGIGERAKHGRPLMEAYGSSRTLLGMDDLMFIPAQIDRFPTDHKTVNTRTVVGVNAKKPLVLSTPIMVSAMGFGLSVTREIKIAIAKATATQDTATNSGDTGFFPEERKHAAHYIVQYSRGHYGNSEEELKQADAIEIRFGQGAWGGLGDLVDGADVDEDLARQLNILPKQGTSRPLTYPQMQSGKDLVKLVNHVRLSVPEIPVGVKVAAGNIEADIDYAIDAGVDFITIDGAQGGTAGAYEVIINNVGVPLVYAIPRAHRHLKKRNVREKITLIATGGLRDAGDFLKALALGTDALYIAESALVAMTYSQWHKLPPGTAPNELFLYWGKHKDKLDVEVAGEALGHFIQASTEELTLLTAAVGKTDIADVNTDDMISLTKATQRVTGVKPAWGE